MKKKTKNQLATIGQRIKDVRAVLRYSQRSMASDLEMSSSYLSEIESGKANPGPDFFLKLADKFDISVEYLFHGRGAMFYGNDRIV
ncbi:MAG: helix-turn-helix transcriptional regulator, partial [bacterium]|nr:helix-turn-helix transcriptional regulator [bacterium]